MKRTPQQKEFLAKLKALLVEYQCSIGFTCSDGSDTHGLYDDHLIIDQKQDGKDVTFFETESWWLEHSNIK